MEPGTDKLSSIQVLRAIAALMVVVYHLASELNSAGTPFPTLFVGASGVDLFFVISGFVMMHASAPLFGAPGNAMYFLTRRVIRIAPLYWLISFVLLLHALARYADLTASDLSIGTLVASFAFIPYPRPAGEWTPLLKVGWTLNYEMFFYVLFAAAIGFRRNTAATLVAGTVFCIAVASAIAWPGADNFKVWPSPVIAEFGFGVAIGAARLSGVRLPNVVASSLMVVAAATLLALSYFDIESPRVLAWGIPMAAIVAGAALAQGDVEGSVWQWPIKIGDASYALYLVHTFMLIPRLVAQRIFGMSDGPWNWWPLAYGAVLIVGCVVAALIVHAYVERPIIRYLNRKIAGTALLSRSPQPVPVRR